MSDDRKKVSIRFNGNEVSDPSALPPEIRKMIEVAEDKLLHSLPRPGTEGETSAATVEIAASSKRYEIGGKTYGSLEEVPAPLRARLEEALKHASADPGQTIERIEINRRAVKTFDDMPPEIRAAAQSMLGSPGSPPNPAPPATQAIDPARASVSVDERRATLSWPVLLLAMLAGALIMYFVLRH